MPGQGFGNEDTLERAEAAQVGLKKVLGALSGFESQGCPSVGPSSGTAVRVHCAAPEQWQQSHPLRGLLGETVRG